jgi:hypothetical protein
MAHQKTDTLNKFWSHFFNYIIGIKNNYGYNKTMLKFLLKLILFPVIKYIIDTFIIKYNGKILMNLPNVLILSGISLLIASQVTLYSLLGIPALSTFATAAMVVGVDRSKGTEIVLKQQKEEAIQTLVNGYYIPDTIQQKFQIAADPFSIKFILISSAVTFGIMYGFLVQHNYVTPIGTLLKNAIFGKETMSRITNDLDNIALKNTVENTPAFNVANNIDKTMEVVTKANYSSAKEWLNFSKILFPTALLGILSFQNKETVYRGAEIMSSIGKYFMDNPETLKRVIRIAEFGFIFFTPLKFIYRTLLAEDFDTETFYKETELFREKFNKYRELLDKDYAETIEHFRRTKNQK